MPNWCHNSMTITGSIDEIARFKQTCLRRVPIAVREALIVAGHRPRDVVWGVKSRAWMTNLMVYVNRRLLGQHRDKLYRAADRGGVCSRRPLGWSSKPLILPPHTTSRAVSYTHLTLPTN